MSLLAQEVHRLARLLTPSMDKLVDAVASTAKLAYAAAAMHQAQEPQRAHMEAPVAQPQRTPLALEDLREETPAEADALETPTHGDKSECRSTSNGCRYIGAGETARFACRDGNQAPRQALSGDPPAPLEGRRPDLLVMDLVPASISHLDATTPQGRKPSSVEGLRWKP